MNRSSEIKRTFFSPTIKSEILFRFFFTMFFNFHDEIQKPGWWNTKKRVEYLKI